MELQEDVIVDISAAQEGFFGGPGKMLLPSHATVEALIKKIPKHQLMTTSLLRATLAAQFNVQGTCPVTTRKALVAIAQYSSHDVAYWRVIKQSGELIAKFPGGVEAHAALLKQEGFTIDSTGKAPKVKNFKASLVGF
jgi:alkylated DNA nucleotide flippase Atl1